MHLNLFHFTSIIKYGVPGTMQATCLDLLSSECLSDFLEYCFPHFTEEVTGLSKVTQLIVAGQRLQSALTNLNSGRRHSWERWVSSGKYGHQTEKHCPTFKWKLCGPRENVAVLLLDLQEKFRVSGEVGKWYRTIQITNVMELIGIKIGLTKLDFLNQKREDWEDVQQCSLERNNALNQQISENQNYPNLTLPQSLQELNLEPMKGSTTLHST